MNRRNIRGLLLILLLFALLMPICVSAAKYEGETPVISIIDPYVIKADVRAYMTQEDIALYKKLTDAVFARETLVKLSRDYDANLRALDAFQGNPYSFFVKKLTFTNNHSAVKLSYAYTKKQQLAMRDFMDSEYITLLNAIIRPGMNELEKVLSVYRYFALRLQYDYDWLDALNLSDDKFLFPEIEIYKALSTNKGVCHSYAYLCEFALQQLNVECLRMTGEMTQSGEGHMWLAVRIDGNYYHCDPTWDSHTDMAGLNYFGMTEKERRDTGVDGYEISYDSAYGEIVCDSDTFSIFRGVNHFSFDQEIPHRLLLEYDDHTAVYNTEDMQLISNPAA